MLGLFTIVFAFDLIVYAVFMQRKSKASFVAMSMRQTYMLCSDLKFASIAFTQLLTMRSRSC